MELILPILVVCALVAAPYILDLRRARLSEDFIKTWAEFAGAQSLDLETDAQGELHMYGEQGGVGFNFRTALRTENERYTYRLWKMEADFGATFPESLVVEPKTGLERAFKDLSEVGTIDAQMARGIFDVGGADEDQIAWLLDQSRFIEALVAVDDPDATFRIADAELTYEAMCDHHSRERLEALVEASCELAKSARQRW